MPNVIEPHHGGRFPPTPLHLCVCIQASENYDEVGRVHTCVECIDLSPTIYYNNLTPSKVLE